MTSNDAKTLARLMRGGALAAATICMVFLGACSSTSTEPDESADDAAAHSDSPPAETPDVEASSSTGSTDGGEATSQATAPDDGADGGDETPAMVLAPREMLGGISLRPGMEWVKETPSSSMRVAQYQLPGMDGGDDASFVITYFGQGGAGAMQMNLDRWTEQMKQPDGVDPFARADISKSSVDGMSVVTLDLTGNYEATVPVPTTIDDARLMVWVVQSPVGPFFIKVVGPKATIDHWESSLRDSFASVLSTS